MSGNNPTPNSDWIRLNVGGKVFQTTKDTLSRYPDTFLARLVNGGVPSDKDESGAYLIDADPEHFRTILNYLRRGSVKLDGTMNLEDLLREADFYNVLPLVDEIRRAMSHKTEDPNKEVINKMSQEIASMSSALSDIRKTLLPGSSTSSAYDEFRAFRLGSGSSYKKPDKTLYEMVSSLKR